MNEISYDNAAATGDPGSLRLHVEQATHAKARLGDDPDEPEVWGPAMPVDQRTAFVAVRGLA